MILFTVLLHSVHFEDKPGPFFSISPDKTISNETIELESFKVQQFALFNRDLHFKFNLFPS